MTEPLARGTRLWRIHPEAHHPPSGRIDDDGTVFNPGVGKPTRFAPLNDAAGVVVPTSYVGASRRGALFETVLHDLFPRSTVDARRWQTHRLTALTLDIDLDVLSLHGKGLRSLGLFATDITHTYPTEYARATRWAQWLHHHTDAAGLTWTSHQDDDERAYVLWGDRIPAGALSPESAILGGTDPLPLGAGHGLNWMTVVAAEVRIAVI